MLSSLREHGREISFTGKTLLKTLTQFCKDITRSISEPNLTKSERKVRFRTFLKMILSTEGKYGVKEKFYLFKKTVETRNSDHNLILPLFLTAIFCSFKIMWDSEMECGEGVGGLLYYIRAYQVQLLMLSQVN